MSGVDEARIAREIEHGKWLEENDPESLWGWTKPAGRIRAHRRAELIIKQGGLRAGVRVMEVGCGSGMFTEVFAATGAHIVAIDVSPHLLKRARERGLPKDRVEFVHGPFEAYQGNQEFDAVIGSSVLHHLDVTEALRNIKRLLRPGGRMAFAEPNYLNPQVFLERKFHHIFPFFDYVSEDETAFVRWSVERRLRDFAFWDIQSRPFDWLHPATPPRFISIIQKIGWILESTPVIREFAGSILISGRKP